MATYVIDARVSATVLISSSHLQNQAESVRPPFNELKSFDVTFTGEYDGALAVFAKIAAESRGKKGERECLPLL